MCQVLKVSRSGYYQWIDRPESGRKKRTDQLKKRITELFIQSRRIYGSPKITAQLRQEGISVSQKTVANLMRHNGLVSRVVRKYKVNTTDSKHAFPVQPNHLNQKFVAQKPNEIWMSDITYVPTKEGWLYLASVMDLYTRKIVGWHADRTMAKSLVIKALERSCHQKRTVCPTLHHSDRGSQYASHEYQSRLRNLGIKISMSRKGNCYDNACIESFHSLLKKECVYLERFHTIEEAESALFDYIEVFYNRQRIHASLGYISPTEFENHYFSVNNNTAG